MATQVEARDHGERVEDRDRGRRRGRAGRRRRRPRVDEDGDSRRGAVSAAASSEIRVREGDSVEEGDVLAVHRLTPAAWRARLQPCGRLRSRELRGGARAARRRGRSRATCSCDATPCDGRPAPASDSRADVLAALDGPRSSSASRRSDRRSCSRRARRRTCVDAFLPHLARPSVGAAEADGQRARTPLWDARSRRAAAARSSTATRPPTRSSRAQAPPPPDARRRRASARRAPADLEAAGRGGAREPARGAPAGSVRGRPGGLPALGSRPLPRATVVEQRRPRRASSATRTCSGTRAGCSRASTPGPRRAGAGSPPPASSALCRARVRGGRRATCSSRSSRAMRAAERLYEGLGFRPTPRCGRSCSADPWGEAAGHRAGAEPRRPC